MTKARATPCISRGCKNKTQPDSIFYKQPLGKLVCTNCYCFIVYNSDNTSQLYNNALMSCARKVLIPLGVKFEED